MIGKWLSDTFNPPAFGNKVLKNSKSKHNYTYGVASVVFGLVATAGVIGGIFSYSLTKANTNSESSSVQQYSTVQTTSDRSLQGLTPD